MSIDDREEFLAGLHVGIIGVNDPRTGAAGPREVRAPLLLPVWYAYQPGGTVDVQTARDSVKARLVQAAGRFSLCVQDETAPYRYVSVEGPVVSVEDPLAPESREALARRYLPRAEAEAYLRGTRAQLSEDLVLRMRPQRWRTADFSAFAAEIDELDGSDRSDRLDRSARQPDAQPLLQGEG